MPAHGKWGPGLSALGREGGSWAVLFLAGGFYPLPASYPRPWCSEVGGRCSGPLNLASRELGEALTLGVSWGGS